MVKTVFEGLNGNPIRYKFAVSKLEGNDVW